MKEVSIWHNPRCSKSREAVKLLEENSIESEVIKYLNMTITIEDMTQLLSMLGLSARELMRTTEDIYKELNLKEEKSEEKLIEAMVSHPKLIQRPIIIKDNKAIIGRPSSTILEFLQA